MSTSLEAKKTRRRDKLRLAFRKKDAYSIDEAGRQSQVGQASAQLALPSLSNSLEQGPTAGLSPAKDLWEEARDDIILSSGDEYCKYSAFLPKRGSNTWTDSEHICRQVLDLAEKKRKRSLPRTARVYGKIVQSVSKFVQVGDIVAQIDPVHVGLPWAGVRLLLQVAVNDSMQGAALLEGLDVVSGLIERYAFFENTYLWQEKALRGPFREKIVTLLRELYKSILFYLLKTEVYFHREKSKRILHAVVPIDEFQQWLTNIKEQDTNIQSFEIMASKHLEGDKEDLAEQDRQLAKLSYATDAAFNSSYRQYEPYCIPDTRVELLGQLEEWSFTGNERIFWLSGMAGTGKSTIARTIASSFSEQDRLGASFFFSRGGGDLAQAAKFVGTLAYQLADVSSPLKRFICESIAEQTNVIHQGLRNQWKTLILRPLKELGSSRSQPMTLMFVIDALDECERDDDIRQILQLFVEIKDLDMVQLRVLVTSRPETAIRLGFRNMPEIIHKDLILHDIPRPIVERDIATFLRHELSDIRRERRIAVDWPGEKKIELLVQKSDCLFIYVATACRFINDSMEDPRDRLILILQDNIIDEESPTAELDHMYTKVLAHSVVKNCSSEAKKKRVSDRFRQIIGPIVVLFDSVSAATLADLLEKSVDLTLDSLHSLLNIPESKDLPIRLLHPSFRDFLLDEKRCLDNHFLVDDEIAHADLAKNCLRLMSTKLRRDMCNLGMSGTLAHDVLSSDINTHLPKHLQYACRYWIDHLERVSKTRRQDDLGLQDDGQVHCFMKQHFLHWLEALSLVGKVSEGVLMIAKLESMLESDQCSALRAITHDAKRFLLFNRSIIEDAPLQAYASALVFSPTQSNIRMQYSDQLPTWIKRLPTVQNNWSSSLQTLEGHSSRVKAVAFSPDGQFLASASRDKTIRLWEPKTGVERNRLEGHSSEVSAVAFSPDGQFLASASYDNTIRLWDPKTGAECNRLEGHSSRVKAVAFSPDGQFLASASRDKTIRLWEPKTGAECNRLEGHSNSVYTVAFSPDSQLLASASGDNTIRLWDSKTGVECHRLEGHSGVVLAVAFSPDSQLLASASDDQTVRLWDPKTGAEYNRLEGHSDFVSAVTFSPDGQLLASVSRDKTVWLWDLKTGVECNRLEGHSDWITAVVFSPNSQLLASTSFDKTVRLWFSKTGVECNRLDHSDWVTAVAFSPDSQLLASASREKTVRLWDLKTGVEHNKLEGHSDWISAVVFSPDSQLLASVSHDRTVRLWDPKIGAECNRLEGHYEVSAVAFSPDGQHLASVSYDDETIRLWDLKTGAEYSQFVAPVVYELSFSADGSHIKTNRGHLKLTYISDRIEISPSTNYPWMITGNWITWNGSKALWLPPDFRPRCSATQGNLFVMGHNSGQVTFLEFNPSLE